MSFLDDYEGTERIDFPGGYWVDVKRCLSHPELQRVQAKLGAGKQSVDLSGRQFATVDPNAYEDEMLVVSITGWNLDGKDGILPFAPEKALRASLDRLAGKVTSAIFAKCNELNGPASRQEQARFPDPGGGRGAGGDGGAAGTGVLPGPEGVLGAARGDEGDAEGAAVAVG